MWSSVLLMLVGIWLILQALVGDLAGRILSWGNGL